MKHIYALLAANIAYLSAKYINVDILLVVSLLALLYILLNALAELKLLPATVLALMGRIDQ